MATTTITLNDINKHIKTVKNIEIKLDVNSDFEQTYAIPKKIGNYTKVESQQNDPKEKKKTYNPGDIIEIPESLTKHCNLDNFYIFGVSYKFNLIESIFYNIDPKFKFESDTKKGEIVSEFKDLLKQNINHLTASKKAKMVKHIDTNTFNNEYIDLCVNYFNGTGNDNEGKLNIICLDVDDNKKYCVNQLSGTDNNIVIIKLYEKYLPLMHMFGESPNYSLCSSLLSNFGD